MSDVFSKEKRSEVMSKIRGKGNKDTELALILILKAYHVTGWRRNQLLVGKPDFTFWKQKVVVFVDGCFWHSCPEHSNIPRNNREFWEKKLDTNKARDEFVTNELQSRGWIVVRIWEHELKKPDLVVERLMKALGIYNNLNIE